LAAGRIGIREEAGMEAQVISKVSRRIVPFVALCYFLCYLDRVNVGFAALQMNNDLGFTATMFGWGAGIFFFGISFSKSPAIWRSNGSERGSGSPGSWSPGGCCRPAWR
jgi:sugar phosphate permease